MGSTITDFDLGMGDDPSHVVRVGDLDLDKGKRVHNSDVNLILWFLLEKEFSSSILTGDEEEEDGVEDQEQVPHNECQVDFKEPRKKFINQSGYGLDGYGPNSEARRVKRHKTAQLKRAKQYSEELLRYVGHAVPFDELRADERQNLFLQFCASSELLRPEKYGSILDLYEGLRRRSKFREQFTISKSLGRGTFGEVLQVTKNETNDILAIKKVRLSFERIDDIRMSLVEAEALKTLRGQKNIVQFYESWIELSHENDDDESLILYISMEACSCSLFEWLVDILKYRKNIERSTLLDIARQTCDGLVAIHIAGYLHLDINPRNILWSQNGRIIKISDFGLAVKSEYYDTVLEGATGTLPYWPPEKLLSSKSDIYSLGVSLFEISEKISTRSELISRIERKNLTSDISFMNCIIPRMLETNPASRPSATDLRNYLYKTY